MSQAMHRRARESPAAVLRDVGFHRPQRAQFEQVLSLDNAILHLLSASVTPEVAPGGIVDVEAEVQNGASVIIEFDPNACINPANPCGASAGNAYCYEVEVTPSWTSGETTAPQCLEAFAIGASERTHRFDFTAPTTPGSYEVAITLRTPGNGEQKTRSFSVNVSEEGGTRPGPGCSSDADCPPGLVCDPATGNCVEEDGDGGGDRPLLEDVQIVLALALGVLIVLAAS